MTRDVSPNISYFDIDNFIFLQIEEQKQITTSNDSWNGKRRHYKIPHDRESLGHNGERRWYDRSGYERQSHHNVDLQKIILRKWEKYTGLGQACTT